MIDDAIALVLSGKVVCNIGQVIKADKRRLEKLVKAGTINKWRGYWYPVPGASYGMGPLKTCWGKRP